ncbi:unnamed protein product [Dicrocoelium dendriticum]|nr:unnamed protein product [Dicrocoelium dendriticum]
MEERVIYPIDEAPPLLGFSQARPSSFTVPSYAGVWPTRPQPKRVPQLEVDVDLTRIVSEEQERRQLHFDAHSVNLFFFLGSHSAAAAAEPSPWAVQLANRTFRLSQPSCVLVPKGIPYKFINASSTDLHLSRVIFS